MWLTTLAWQEGSTAIFPQPYPLPRQSQSRPSMNRHLRATLRRTCSAP